MERTDIHASYKGIPNLNDFHCECFLSNHKQVISGESEFVKKINSYSKKIRQFNTLGG